MLAHECEPRAREDLLRLFTARPAETGDVRLLTKVELPPGPQGFLRRLRLDGDFGIGGGHFTDPKVQMPVNRLAESARGETKDQEEVDPTTVFQSEGPRFGERRDCKAF